jgi:hypothetical protein
MHRQGQSGFVNHEALALSVVLLIISGLIARTAPGVGIFLLVCAGVLYVVHIIESRQALKRGANEKTISESLPSEEFRNEFGSDSGLEGSDFRPHFDGFFFNAYRVSARSASRDAHMTLVWAYVREMAEWILARRERFQPGDRFQLIVGWPETVRTTSRQIVKLGGTFDQLAQIAATKTFADYQSASNHPVFLPGWDKSIYE